MPVPILALPQLCATCNHKHTGAMVALTVYPACPDCGCAEFRVHPDELAAAEADEALQQAYYPHGRILDADLAHALTQAFTALEAGNADGWDRPPRLGCFYGSLTLGAGGTKVRPPHDPHAYLAGFMAAPLNLNYADLLRATDANPNVFVPVLADMARHRPAFFDAYRWGSDLNPADPVLAWWVSWEGYVRGTAGDDLTVSAADRPELVTDEIRSSFMIDIDERVHEINRLRRAGTVTTSVEPWPLFAARIAGEAPAGAGLVAPDGGMPPVFAGLVSLVRHCRVETSARNAMRQAFGGEKPEPEKPEPGSA